jgi:hypothetical protein
MYQLNIGVSIMTVEIGWLVLEWMQKDFIEERDV